MNVRLSADTEYDISYLLSTNLYPSIDGLINLALEILFQTRQARFLTVNESAAHGSDRSNTHQLVKQPPIAIVGPKSGKANASSTSNPHHLTDLWSERDSWIVTLPPRSSDFLKALLNDDPAKDSANILESAIANLCEIRKEEHFRAAIQTGIDSADRGELVDFTEGFREDIRRSVHEKHQERQRNTQRGHAWSIPHDPE